MSSAVHLGSKIQEGARLLEVSLSGEAEAMILSFLQTLLHWNRSINLVGPCTHEEALERHVFDALALLRVLDRAEVGLLERPWFDVGSGAGLPGLVLAAARPGLDLHILEPRGKRATFCRQMVKTLGLSSVTVHEERLEALEMPDGSGAMSRATFAPEVWAQRGAESVGPGGLVLVLMADHPSQEVLDASWIVDRVQLPGNAHQRTNALIRVDGP
jgi:16S rRNA (guanine527-N7)-methyltransferase